MNSKKTYIYFSLAYLILTIGIILFSNNILILTIAGFIYLLEYIYRTINSENKINYIFSIYGILDFLSTLMIFSLFYIEIGILGIIGLFKLFRFFKRFLITNSNNDQERAIFEILDKNRFFLRKFLIIALLSILISGFMIYIIERNHQPENFRNLLDGVWWSFITMTTVGYGDIFPITTLGRILGIWVSLFGITLFSIPVAIITSEIVNYYNMKKNEKEKISIYKELYDKKYLSIEEYENLFKKEGKHEKNS